MPETVFGNIKGMKTMEVFMKKTIAIMLVAFVAAFCLLANGATEAKAATTVEYTPNGTYPIVTTPITVDIMVVQPPCVEDFNTNEFSKYMAKKTGVNVNFIMVPEQTASEKLSLTLASGDYPDAFLGFGIDGDLEATYGSQEHMFLPLNKYYTKEWMPNMMAALADFPGSIGYLTNIDGNIYSLSRLEGCFHCSNQAKMFVYQPFLDKLGLKAPTTTDELYTVLKAIKTQDPNGNGKADEIPMAGSIVGWSDNIERFLLNSFVYCDIVTDINANAISNVGFKMDGRKVDTCVNKDAYRQGLSYIAKLYKEGLIYNGSFTQDSNQLTQLVESSAEPVVGFAAGGWRGQFTAIGGDRFLNYRAIAPLKGPKGVQEAANFFQDPGTGALVISADSKYADAIIRYFDYMFSEQGTLEERNGFEGTAWKWADANQVGLDGKPAVWQQLTPWNDKDPQNVSWIQIQVGSMSYALKNGLAKPQITQDDPAYYEADNNEKVLYDETANLYKPYAHTDLEVPTLKFTAEENEKYSTLRVELANYIRQSCVKFMVGTLDVNNDAVWNEYLANLDKLQLGACLESMQVAYDRQYK